jgi:hypothetical protein
MMEPLPLEMDVTRLAKLRPNGRAPLWQMLFRSVQEFVEMDS